MRSPPGVAMTEDETAAKDADREQETDTPAAGRAATSSKRLVKRSPKRKLPVAGTVDARMKNDAGETRRRAVEPSSTLKEKVLPRQGTALKRRKPEGKSHAHAAEGPGDSPKQDRRMAAPKSRKPDTKSDEAPKSRNTKPDEAHDARKTRHALVAELSSSQSSVSSNEDFNALTPFLASSGDLVRQKSLHAKVEHMPHAHHVDRPPLSPGRSPFAAHIDFTRPLNRSPKQRRASDDDATREARDPSPPRENAHNLMRQRLHAGRANRSIYLDKDDDTRDYVVVPPSASQQRPSGSARAKLSKKSSSVLRPSTGGSFLENTASMSSTTSSQLSSLDGRLNSRHDASYLLD